MDIIYNSNQHANYLIMIKRKVNIIQSKEYSNEVQVTKLCGALTTRLTPAQVLSPLTTKKAVGSLENCHWGLNLAEKFKLTQKEKKEKKGKKKKNELDFLLLNQQ